LSKRQKVHAHGGGVELVVVEFNEESPSFFLLRPPKPLAGAPSEFLPSFEESGPRGFRMTVTPAVVEGEPDMAVCFCLEFFLDGTPFDTPSSPKILSRAA